jgi:hypothetical protein
MVELLSISQEGHLFEMSSEVITVLRNGYVSSVISHTRTLSINTGLLGSYAYSCTRITSSYTYLRYHELDVLVIKVSYCI